MNSRDKAARKRAVTFAAGFGAAMALLVVATTSSAAEFEPDPRLAPAEIMPLAAHRILNDVARVGDRYIAVGMRGHVLASNDGKTWTQKQVPTRTMLVAVAFPTNKVGYAAGHDGAIIKTSDGGETWELLRFDPAPNRPPIIYDLYFPTADTGFAVGSYGLMLRTTDGGANWERLEPDFASYIGYHNSAITAFAPNSLLIVGERGIAARSTDGGDSWEMLASPYTGSFFGAVADGKGGALVHGMRGRAYRVADVMAIPAIDATAYDPFSAQNVEDPAAMAEMGWTRITPVTEESFFASSALPNGGAVLVGNAGTIVTTDKTMTKLTLKPNPLGDTLAAALPVGDRFLMVGRQGVEWH
ncbi:hypothetical protein GYB61_10805 [bacterium]|nr:hypothetical protein [bacterium]